MKGAISYSLFGYGKARQENCFVFGDYLRGLTVNIRLAKVLYPEFTVVVHVDQSTYEGLVEILEGLPIEVVVCNNAELTKAMLWRMKPIFNNKYTHVLCRDLDSPLMYRERKAVQYWLNKGKMVHAITDSISHDVPMLGGMIGFRTDFFADYTGYNNWDDMVNSCNYNWSQKGNDQTFLSNFIYPKFAQHGNDSITQHYLLGMPNTFLSDWTNKIDMNIDIPVDYRYKCTDDLGAHIGCAGILNSPMHQFIKTFYNEFEDINRVELLRKDIFYWHENI